MDILLETMLDREQITMGELSEKTNMSEAIIYARLERYEQLGYVKKVVEHVGGGCSGTCGSCKGCGTHRPEFKLSVYWIRGEKLG